MVAAFRPTATGLLVLSLLVVAVRSDTAATPVTPSTACNETTDPNFCRTVLPSNGTNNLYTYGRFSVAKSLANANKFLGLVNRYLARGGLSPGAVAALQDCQLLSGLNIDFLYSADTTLNTSANGKLLDPQAEEVQTLLSAILTNQQTCADGLQVAASAWSVRNGLSVPMVNSTKLYSVSLSLFTRAWVKSSGKKSKGSSATKPPHHGHGRGLFDATDDEMVRRMALEGAAAAVPVVGEVTVDQSGGGNYTTIGAAVAAAPSNLGGSSGYFVINVPAGVYEENVVVPKNKKYVMMIGDGIGQTVVTGNRSVIDGWTTFNSATFAVLGTGFVAVNMTFRNTAGPAKHQAVALRSGADLSTFYRCSFEAYQDTLYTHSLRQFYRACDIYGTVDYVFGNAAVVFQDCGLYSRLPMQGQSNTMTAQGRTDPNQNTGTTLQGCTIAAAPDLAANTAFTVATYLGRPWKLYSRTVIMQSEVDALVDPAGWMPWDGNFALGTLFYAEYNNSGPGADTSRRVAWPGFHVLNTTADAGNFTVGNMVLGDFWLPQTGVPFTSGLN
ncbi:putative pectinesterase/pectinesterase inhibitor 41 [Dichanthelium oligosanthes]|uniref:Pectinesterase n=1 Tax=Dichanthelium oligosanthes TaxID=888268 RepID=A0A1E5UUP5_9POAL|nr:putative pectinesterase/pectinesterase inhibitor 41 [Dichanthelium oligosanthes]